MRFGKLPARPDSIRLKFRDVFNQVELPTPPKEFGHENLMTSGYWFMLANDVWGDCVFAGAAHEHMLWTMEGGTPRARFTSRDVLSDYSKLTGFDPTRPDSDQGTDMQVAASYRQKIGVVDSSGMRHKIDAYSALTKGNLDEIALATWLFGAVGIGIRCPASMKQQFRNGPWSVVTGDKVEDGHYMPCIGRDRDGNLLFISWGAVQPATPEWVETYMDEGIAYLSLEIINSSTKLSPESFNMEALSQYLVRLT